MICCSDDCEESPFGGRKVTHPDHAIGSDTGGNDPRDGSRHSYIFFYPSIVDDRSIDRQLLETVIEISYGTVT